MLFLGPMLYIVVGLSFSIFHSLYGHLSIPVADPFFDSNRAFSTWASVTLPFIGVLSGSFSFWSSGIWFSSWAICSNRSSLLSALIPSFWSSSWWHLASSHILVVEVSMAP